LNENWYNTFCTFSSVLLDDGQCECSKSSTKALPFVQCENHSKVYFYLWYHKGIFKLSVSLESCFLKVKRKPDEILCSLKCDILQGYSNCRMCDTHRVKHQLHKNAVFCYVDTHLTNLQEIT
jgi:hypothetical protein